MQSKERGRLRYAVNPTTSENEQESSDKASHDDEQECLCNMAPTSNWRETSMPAHWRNSAWIVRGTATRTMYSQAARRKQQLSYLATTHFMGLAIPTPKRIASLLSISIIFGIMLMTMKQITNYIIPEHDPLCPSPSIKVQSNVQISYSVTEKKQDLSYDGPCNFVFHKILASNSNIHSCLSVTFARHLCHKDTLSLLLEKHLCI